MPFYIFNNYSNNIEPMWKRVGEEEKKPINSVNMHTHTDPKKNITKESV